MDWCQKYTDGPHHGQYKTWYWDQVIMISETEDPQFTSRCEDKVAESLDADCKKGYIELTMASRDNCTKPEDMKWRYQIDLFNDGKDLTNDGINNGSFDIDSKNFKFPNNIISGPTANASGEYPIGKHRIVWTTWDQCGNKITCDKFFTIKSVKKPTPICIDQLVIELMPVDTDKDGKADWAMIELPANICEGCSPCSFHPCGHRLVYSYSADTLDKKRIFDCNDVINPDKVPVEMWVTAVFPDGSITQDYCRTTIDFQDNNDVCPPALGDIVKVNGTVTTVNNLPITNVNIAVQGSELGPQTTNNSGAYEFSVESERDYVMTPDKDGDDLNGVSTLDLVLIQKHILGLKPITNPYMLLAANANTDNKVSASDILALRKLILGESSDIGKSWRFMPKNYQFVNPVNPYGETVPSSASINPKENTTVDFYGIKIGDMNFSLIESRSSENLVFAIDAQNIVPGEVAVPVYSENINAAEGFQFTIKYDNDVLSFNEIEALALKSLSNSNIGLSKADNGIITISWNKVGQETISNEEPLFVLKFNANKATDLQNALTFNSSVVKKEAYNAELEVMGIELNYRNAGNEFTLYQNTPNPFSEFTDINFFLPENTKGTLTINDLSGKVVMIKEGDFTKGLNTVRINKSELNVSGVMYYRLETEGNTATRKMILIK